MAQALPYVWLQQLAGILPLFALIEFIDVHTKLHLFQLRGSVFVWAWPVTPTGARLLLSKENDDGSCCLDRPTRGTTLHCIDCRHGNCYPSAAPTTVRLCVAAQESSRIVSNHTAHMKDPTARKQSLEIIVLRRLNPTLTPLSVKLLGTSLRVPLWSTQHAVSILGFGLLIGGVISALVFRFYIAGAYLLLMPLTGVAIRLSHGSEPQGLLDSKRSSHLRLVIAANSLNESKWLLFYGESRLVNSLLNKPFSRRNNSTTPSPRLLYTLLLVLIGAQWSLALGSSALQDWNALIITLWIIFCVLVDSHVYGPVKSAQDWLRRDCHIKFDCIKVSFSSRRSMLSAIVALSPDTVEKRMGWIDPILVPGSTDRQEWELALLRTLEPDADSEDAPVDKYWWKFIQEGIEMASKTKAVIEELRKQPA